MKIALCTRDGKTYDAVTFSMLREDVLEDKRHHLVCVLCNAAAYFRKRTIDGKPPCFGAKPHKEGCNASTMNTNSQEDSSSAVEVVNAIRNTGTHIKLVLKVVKNHAHSSSDGRHGSTGNKPHQRHTGSNERTRSSHYGLTTLLKNFLIAPEFSKSQRTLEFDDQIYSFSNLFVNFKEINPLEIGLLKGFWGQLTGARRDASKSVWLNTGGAGFSFLVEERFVKDFLTQFKISDLEELAGINVLVLGTMRESGKKKLYCKIDDIRKVTIIK